MIEFWTQLWTVTAAGGMLMIVLFVLAIAIYWLAIDTLTSLPGGNREKQALLRRVTTPEEVSVFEKEQLLFFKNRKTLLQILVTTAPLLGLLGTVTGMLATFQGLNASNGNTFDLVAAGISEAMITTETGLVIAIPASFMVMFIGSRIRAVEESLLRIASRYRSEQLTIRSQARSQ